MSKPLLVERDHGGIGLRRFDRHTVRVGLPLVVSEGPENVLHESAILVLDDVEAELLSRQLSHYAGLARSNQAGESG